MVRSIFFIFAAWSWTGTAWRSWTVLRKRGFQQAVSLIITHAVPSDPGRFLPLADLLGDAYPVTGEKERKEEGRERVCGVCVCAHGLSQQIDIRLVSVSCAWPLVDLAPHWRLEFVFCWGFENVRGTLSFTPSLIEVSGCGSVKSPDLNVPVWGGSNSIAEKWWNNRKYLASFWRVYSWTKYRSK